MSVTTINFTTGPATLPDVGKLSYNGCEFSPLFETNVSGVAVKDVATRTVKYMEYTLSVDGYVTAPDGLLEEATLEAVAETITNLRRLLTAQGGALVYKGRGCELVVNNGAGGVMDVAWGPSPELLEFQPLGGGLSAKVKWVVKVRIPEVSRERKLSPVPPSGLSGAVQIAPGVDDPFVGSKPGAGGAGGVGGAGRVGGVGGASRIRGGLANVPLLQFNYDSSVSYEEDGFSTLSVKGTLEIPMTRTPSQQTRTLTQTADAMRSIIETRIMAGIDLDKFRITKRNFNLSRDKRTLEWDFVAEEKPYMDLPADCTVARGTYSVRPASQGMGLINWLCTLRATYTVRADRPRRTAWLAFLYLLRLRMAAPGLLKTLPGAATPAPAAQAPKRATRTSAFIYGLTAGFLGTSPTAHHNAAPSPISKAVDPDANKALLMNFSFEEGLYLDSKSISFSATWRFVTTFNHILIASGVWTKLKETNDQGKNLWAISMRDVQGAQSWLENAHNPALDVIVDFGS